MLKVCGGWTIVISHTLLPVSSNYDNSTCTVGNCSSTKALRLGSKRVLSTQRWARRRVRYNEEDEEDGDEYGHNPEIAMLEMYSQSATNEVLLVKALVDGQEVEVLIFKGFSSCLSYKTSADPSRSVVPARAVIKCIDRIKGPFDPSNIEYLEKGLAWESFKTRFLSN